jgi:hypothetical protein
MARVEPYERKISDIQKYNASPSFICTVCNKPRRDWTAGRVYITQKKCILCYSKQPVPTQLNKTYCRHKCQSCSSISYKNRATHEKTTQHICMLEGQIRCDINDGRAGRKITKPVLMQLTAVLPLHVLEYQGYPPILSPTASLKNIISPVARRP